MFVIETRAQPKATYLPKVNKHTGLHQQMEWDTEHFAVFASAGDLKNGKDDLIVGKFSINKKSAQKRCNLKNITKKLKIEIFD